MPDGCSFFLLLFIFTLGLWLVVAGCVSEWRGPGVVTLRPELSCLPTSHFLLAEFRQKGEIEKLRIRKCSDFEGFQSPEVRRNHGANDRKYPYRVFWFAVWSQVIYETMVFQAQLVHA